jgi:branched-chain amino acid transport system ATP-binding protein
MLLLDEPMAGLGTAECARMIDLLKVLKTEVTILLVEHDMDAVFALADRISVLVNGERIATGSADEIRVNEAVRVAYLGEGDA